MHLIISSRSLTKVTVQHGVASLLDRDILRKLEHRNMLAEGRDYVTIRTTVSSPNMTRVKSLQKSKGFGEFRGDEYLGVMKPCLKTRNLIIVTVDTCTN